MLLLYDYINIMVLRPSIGVMFSSEITEGSEDVGNGIVPDKLVLSGCHCQNY